MLDDGGLRPLIEPYLAAADDSGAEGRAAVFRLAWAFVGSVPGNRRRVASGSISARGAANRENLALAAAGDAVAAARAGARAGLALVDAMLSAERSTA
ncbi:MAG: hypothetical protein ACKVWR_04345 [Acidimicrobiales bacterium]